MRVPGWDFKVPGWDFKVSGWDFNGHQKLTVSYAIGKEYLGYISTRIQDGRTLHVSD